MKAFGSIAVGILAVSAVAFLFFTWMNNLIPPGRPPVAVVEPFNDANDLTPREPVNPKGPHLDEFINNCTACHSTRLTMTQPDLPATKWTEVVKKMVTVYGAQIDAPLEEKIVKYLSAVKGAK